MAARRAFRRLLQRAVNYETEKQLLFQVDYVHPFEKTAKSRLADGAARGT